LTTGVEVQEIGNVALMNIKKVRVTGVDRIVKRVMDLVISSLVLLFAGPFVLLLALVLKLDSPGPIIHRRRVIGLGGKSFDAFKLRTMRHDADEWLAQHPELQAEYEKNYKLENDPRITRLGHFMRRTSLDEVPQLLNVLSGQMSLVGPRMITSQELKFFGKWDLNLLTVKPGITGPWQANGRSDLTYEDRVKLNMQYIRNYSIWLDIYLLWQTFWVVLKREGAH
jgi:lipopolysaccharide/colanic/teichoic acid biosynthesis glycosyltransferase